MLSAEGVIGGFEFTSHSRLASCAEAEREHRKTNKRGLAAAEFPHHGTGDAGLDTCAEWPPHGQPTFTYIHLPWIAYIFSDRVAVGLVWLGGLRFTRPFELLCFLFLEASTQLRAKGACDLGTES